MKRSLVGWVTLQKGPVSSSAGGRRPQTAQRKLGGRQGGGAGLAHTSIWDVPPLSANCQEPALSVQAPARGALLWNRTEEVPGFLLCEAGCPAGPHGWG